MGKNCHIPLAKSLGRLIQVKNQSTCLNLFRVSDSGSGVVLQCFGFILKCFVDCSVIFGSFRNIFRVSRVTPDSFRLTGHFWLIWTPCLHKCKMANWTEYGYYSQIIVFFIGAFENLNVQDLGIVPFAALHESDGARYLIEACAISVSPYIWCTRNQTLTSASLREGTMQYYYWQLSHSWDYVWESDLYA